MEKEKSILEEIREFLEYIIKAGRDNQKRSWEFLKRKLGEKKYEIIYDFCVERGYISSLPYKKEKGKDHYIYIKANGFAFLEEQQKEKRKEEHLKVQTLLSYSLFAVAFFQALIFIFYNYFNLKQNSLGDANLFVILSCIFLVAIFVTIIKIAKNL